MRGSIPFASTSFEVLVRTLVLAHTGNILPENRPEDLLHDMGVIDPRRLASLLSSGATGVETPARAWLAKAPLGVAITFSLKHLLLTVLTAFDWIRDPGDFVQQVSEADIQFLVAQNSHLLTPTEGPVTLDSPVTMVLLRGMQRIPRDRRRATKYYWMLPGTLGFHFHFRNSLVLPPGLCDKKALGHNWQINMLLQETQDNHLQVVLHASMAAEDFTLA